MGFSLFKNQATENKFWNWFSKHQETYFSGADDQGLQEKLFDDLSRELRKVHEDLVFEFSPIHNNGIRELTISAEGIRELFPVVEKLIGEAPEIKNWQFNAFRQRVPGDDFKIEFGDINIAYSDIYFRYVDGDYGKLGIELNIRNYDGQGQTQNAVYILLDGLIGEYDVAMGIDWIDWVKLEESNIDNLNPIVSLRTLIDQKKP